ncbi:MAG: HAMP domain-containing histidine kinase [Bacteroidia bacterium]|nr:HAMP domain-containing histidine kinase [Bacteroidia bacterium]
MFLFLPVWEGWAAPQGRWGAFAFPIVGENGEVYVVDGRRIWRFNTGRWEELYRLPEEVRAGVVLGEDTLVLGGLGIVFWVTPHQVQSLRVQNTGWIYRMWRIGGQVALKGVQASLIGRMQKEAFHIARVQGEWMGVTRQGFVLRRGDTLLSVPDDKVLLCGPLASLAEVTEVAQRLWLLSVKGKATPVPTQGQIPNLCGGRQWVGPYLLSEKALFVPGSSKPLWESYEPIYAGAYGSQLIALLTSSECIFLYPEAPISWLYRWPIPVAQAYNQGLEWVVWQGETAVYPNGYCRYPATLIEPAFYQGEWLWATPRGILRQNGQTFALAGRYVGAIAAAYDRLAWASGVEVFIRRGREERQYRFPEPIRRLGWTGDTLWAWRARTLYWWTGESWRSRKLPFQPEDALCWRGAWYFKVGVRWLYAKGIGWDTLYQTPWLPTLPLSHGWGRPLWSFYRSDTLWVITSLGLLSIRPSRTGLPPLQVSAVLQGPALQQKRQQLILPAERPFVELSWRAKAPFLPIGLRAFYQIGEDPPIRLTESKLIFSLSRPGKVRLRLWVEHPWYTYRRELTWEVEVMPPWYESWWFRSIAVIVFVILMGGILYLREWNLRRIQARLAQEREYLLTQTQLQQTQLLQSERMANLGIMAAHIAHEINTPLGIIRSALSEIEENLDRNEDSLILPAEARPSPTRIRELRQAWQTQYPTLTLAQVQELSTLGYTPEQMQALARWLEDPEKWSAMLRFLRLRRALNRAAEAAEKLQARVQAIRTYVRGIEEGPTQPVSLSQSLQATLEFYRPMMRRTEVETYFPDKALYVCAGAARLEQVWANLIQNALQAMPEGGKLTIRIEQRENQAWIYIQDTGKGIPPHLREAIFEPLFTTKAPGEGTGLGLPLCKQIVESYGGTLKLLHSEPGYTLFGVVLPLCEASEGAPS